MGKKENVKTPPSEPHLPPGPLGTLGAQGAIKGPPPQKNGGVALDAGVVPIGVKGMRALKQGDVLLYKRVEDRPMEEIPYAQVEVEGVLNPLESMVTFLSPYNGSWKGFEVGTIVKAAAFELFWDGKTPVNPKLEGILRSIRPQLL